MAVVVGEGEDHRRRALGARVEDAGQLLADDELDLSEIVRGQHGVLRRERRGREAPAGAIAAARGRGCDVRNETIYAAAPWDWLSLADRFGGRGHTEVGMPSSRSSFCASASDGVFPPASN